MAVLTVCEPFSRSYVKKLIVTRQRIRSAHDAKINVSPFSPFWLFVRALAKRDRRPLAVSFISSHLMFPEHTVHL